MLDEGSSSCVFQVYKPDLGVVAAKVMKKEDFNIKELQNIIKLSQESPNPFLLKYISANIYGENAVIIMEVCTVLLRRRKIFLCQQYEQS
ncbi:MAG: hypothetical protein EZS28_050798 [Streblomastix strix]|uniref:Protein kinase domain-containing protein n=1 Tax=Streblomastix strix TaxID=222440 RepID=A0A5J4T8F9_9EUKA|nr:MAG: hypothetical protein EZS28_050798 [Streblomastix strix]